MDIAEFRDFCLSLPFTRECTPFDEDTLVFKVADKMFAYTSISRFNWVSVKCDPEEIVDFIERYDYAGYAPHMSRKHWLGILTDHSPPDSFIKERVRESYRLVIGKMPKTAREELKSAIKKAGYDI